ENLFHGRRCLHGHRLSLHLMGRSIASVDTRGGSGRADEQDRSRAYVGTRATDPVIRQSNHIMTRRRLMRRTLLLLLTAVALVGMVAPGAYAQAPAAPAAPTPTFKITGFIDEVITYSNNTSNFDFDLHRKDYLFYGRTRGRFDIVGEYGKAKAVLGLELDFVYGQTGTGNSNIATVQGGATPNPAVGNAVAVFPGTDGSLGLNTDVRGILEIKWLYTEFEIPYIPV